MKKPVLVGMYDPNPPSLPKSPLTTTPKKSKKRPKTVDEVYDEDPPTKPPEFVCNK